MTNRARMAGVSALALGLMAAGCGGGGGVASTPTPPPVTYPTMAGLTGTTALPATAVRYDYSWAGGPSSPTVTAVDMPALEITYDASARTYTLRSVEASGAAAIEQRFGPAQLVAGQADTYDATATTGGVTSVSRFQVDSGVNLTYSRVGHWETGTGGSSQNFHDFYFSYGIQTKAGDMPTTGTATYSLSLRGEQAAPVIGSGSLNANFAAGTVAISLSPEYFYRPGQAQNIFATLTGTGTINSANPGFGMNIAGDGYSGTVNGLFYGPQAVEVGGAFSVLSPMGGVAAAGAFSGRRN